MWSPLARQERLLHYDLVTIPRPLLTPIPRFAVVGGAGGLLAWCVGGAHLAIIQGLCLGLLVASPILGQERRTSRGLRTVQFCSVIWVVAMVAVPIWAFIELPLLLALFCLGLVSPLFLCLTGFVNLLIELAQITRALAKRG
jgi:hypothetical protein